MVESVTAILRVYDLWNPKLRAKWRMQYWPWIPPRPTPSLAPQVQGKPRRSVLRLVYCLSNRQLAHSNLQVCANPNHLKAFRLICFPVRFLCSLRVAQPYRLISTRKKAYPISPWSIPWYTDYYVGNPIYFFIMITTREIFFFSIGKREQNR